MAEINEQLLSILDKESTELKSYTDFQTLSVLKELNNQTLPVDAKTLSVRGDQVITQNLTVLPAYKTKAGSNQKNLIMYAFDKEDKKGKKLSLNTVRKSVIQTVDSGAEVPEDLPEGQYIFKEI